MGPIKPDNRRVGKDSLPIARAMGISARRTRRKQNRITAVRHNVTDFDASKPIYAKAYHRSDPMPLAGWRIFEVKLPLSAKSPV
jgi:hypothetical protein